MNKKGAMVDYLVESIPRIFYIFFAAALLVWLVNIYSTQTLDTKQVQAEVLYNRVMYSPDLFWDEDELGNMIPGRLNLESFSSQTLEEGINYEAERYAAAQLTVFDSNGLPLMAAFLNKDKYNQWKPMAEAGISGEGSATMYTKRSPITIINNGREEKGVLEVRIVIPHS